ARAAPDGYTLLVGTSTSLSVNPVLMKVAYDPARDFTAISELGTQPHVFVVNPAVPAKSLREFIALAKAKPGLFRYSSSGNGGPAHLAGELFKQATGADLVHVPYRGQAAAIISVASGEVQFSIPSIASVLPQIRAGKLRAIAVTSQHRVAIAGDIPTLAEEGYAGIESSSWTGVFGPVRIPEAIVVALRQKISLALRSTVVAEKFAAAGVTPGGESGTDFASFVQKDIAKWAKVVRVANIHTD
ncbi:MAG TPA: tripartite tricarboxylate transporter substrate binding protein, partial [Burkholderiales bacterium]|nr:tripartite tricarboxylate transporter substrate binding protein [Burkholderiales bacterium]